jgi:hypothetical protein
MVDPQHVAPATQHPQVAVLIASQLPAANVVDVAFLKRDGPATMLADPTVPLPHSLARFAPNIARLP